MAAAGLPGTGIGGLFYVVTAILAPFRHAWRRLTGRPTTSTGWDAVVSALLGVGVIGGIWVAGWLLGLVIPRELLPAGPSIAHGVVVAAHNVVRGAAIVAGFGTLALVLVAVETARLLARRRMRGVRVAPHRDLP